jgi:hypothetical protein
MEGVAVRVVDEPLQIVALLTARVIALTVIVVEAVAIQLLPIS